MKINKKRVGLAAIIVLLVCISVLLQHRSDRRDELYQVATLTGLLQGDYDGFIALKEIGRHGDFGIGTYDRLDGEAVELDGVFYQIRADGAVKKMGGRDKAPFAMTTFFKSDITFQVAKEENYRSLQKFLDSHIPDKDIPYAVRIDGKFSYIKLRSVPAQDKPYPTLAEVVKNQSVFEFNDIEGTLLGFRLPDYMQGVNMPGYHMHFLSRDKTKGGHVLDAAVNSGEAKFDDIHSFSMVLR